MAKTSKLFELEQQQYENHSTLQGYLSDDSQEMYEEVDNPNIKQIRSGNKYSFFGIGIKENSNTAVGGLIGLQSCSSQEEDSQETYEAVDDISIKQTETGNKYPVLGKGLKENSNEVKEASSAQKAYANADKTDIVPQRRDSVANKWKLISFAALIVIIALTTAIVIVLIQIDSRKALACDSVQCLHMGTCSTDGNKAICNCQNGYYGDRCQFTPCNNATCLNEGQCIVWNNSYICICPEGYSGDNCQDDSCARSPCLNQGTCTPHGYQYDCACRNGYHGSRCENYVCSSSPCLNQGTCVPRGVDYDCSCRTGFYGERCENEGSFVKSIQSPGFPSTYPHNLNRTWTTDVGSGYVAVLRFKNFSTEYGYDYVTVYNGGSTGSNLLYKWCGKMLPTDMRATGTQITVQMTSDGSQTRTGFKADVYKIKK